jgi:hypothetical protein
MNFSILTLACLVTATNATGAPKLPSIPTER